MNPSIERRLSIWLSIVILVAGLVAAALSYVLAYRDATQSQDSQLTQVASAVSRGSYKDVPPNRDITDEESVDAFIVVPVGDSRTIAHAPDLQLPAEIGDGLQTVSRHGGEWRVRVTRDSNGERFAVVQSIEARAEDARDSARLTLVPIALLIPVLLLAVHLLLKTLFSPLAQLAREVDLANGNDLAAIPDAHVPREVLPFVEAVNRLLHRLGQAMTQQGRFIADAAHELRSPVAALMVQAENVQHSDLSVEAKERVSSLRSGLVRLAGLQDQLLSFARARAPATMPPQIIEFDVVVRHAIEDLLPMALAKNIDVGCARLDPVRILGEMRHATSLVRNAMDNAIRYTPPGGVVDITLSREGGVATFVIEDTGPGIDRSDLVRVFEPFVRVLGTREPGSGLGLAIVRAAADAMRGRVDLSGREDGSSGLRLRYRQPAM